MPEQWAAKWIDPELPHVPEGRQPDSVLRRLISVNETGKVRFFITCHGLNVARLNGQRIGDFVLAPGTGDYHQRLTVQV